MSRARPFSAVEQFFAALSRRDPAAISAAVTRDFLLLEHGELWDCGKLVEAIQGTRQRRNFFALVESEVVGERAWVAYWNKAELLPSGGSPTQHFWLESAFLQRVDTDWRVRLLHSTRVDAGGIPAGVDLQEYIDPNPLA